MARNKNQKKNNNNPPTTSMDHSLTKLVKELRTINDFEVELPQDNIKDVLVDPKKWAEEFSESLIINFIPKFIKAKKLGKELAQEVLDDKKN